MNNVTYNLPFSFVAEMNGHAGVHFAHIKAYISMKGRVQAQMPMKFNLTINPNTYSFKSSYDIPKWVGYW